MSAQRVPTALPRRPKAGKKYFTLDEANRALTYIAPIADDIADRYHQALRLRTRLDDATTEAVLDELREQYEKLMDRLNDNIDELRAVGVELKDFERGLIDFPAWHDGREVCLCWHRGETSVQHWHELDAGFAGRQTVALLQTEDNG